MFFNVFIKIDEKEKLITDVFYYNEEKHYLNYHLPYNDKYKRLFQMLNVKSQ